MIFIGFSGYAQGPTSYWHFGNQASIRFVNFIPAGNPGNPLFMTHDCSSISNSSSNLQYFARTDTCLNSLSESVANGSGLPQNTFGGQGLMFIPHPSDPSVYYLIHSSSSPSKLFYSKIEKSLLFPLGRINSTEKNIELGNQSSARLTAVLHDNGKDIWVINREYYSDKFNVYLVTDDGVDPPIVSILDTAFSPVGQLKASPDGRFLAEANPFHQGDSRRGAIYRFNNLTGEVSEEIVINDWWLWSYGVEFTSDSRYVFFSNNKPPGALYRYNLDVYDSSAVISSLDSLISPVYYALQIGIDRRIYASRWASFPYLSCIINPQEENPNALLQDSQAVDLAGGECDAGLPDFITSFFRPAYFDFTNACVGDSVKFFSRHPDIDSLIWDFGDPSSGVSNFSQELQPSHLFSSDGTFTVTLTLWADSTVDTFSREIILIEPPNALDLGDSIQLCSGDTIGFDIAQDVPYVKYLWNDSTESSISTRFSEGWAWAIIYNHCDTLKDSVYISMNDSLTLEMTADTTLCEQDSLLLSPELPESTNHNWSTNQTTPTISVGSWLSNNLEPITISLTASNACGEARDSLTISFIPLPDATLPPDSTHCFDGPIFLRRPSQDSTIYVWSDSSSAEMYRFDSTGSVWLSAQNSCGVQIDSFSVLFHPEIKVELGEDTFLCPGDSVVLEARWLESIYSWSANAVFVDSAQNDGRLTVRYEDVIESGLETYVVTITNGPCSKVEARTIAAVDDRCDSTACKFSIPNVFTPNGDGLNDVLRISNACSDLTFRVFIYNRWGQLMFEDKAAASRYNPASGVATRRDSHIIWDGYLNGEPASAGTYYIVVETDVGRLQKGYFTLLR